MSSSGESALPKPQSVQGHQVLRAAGAIGAATFMSRIMGLVREQAFAFLFGAGNATDAFNVAFRIPNLLRDLFAEGAMSASLVPTFTRARIEEGDRRAWRVAGLVFRVLFVTVSLIAALGVLFAPELVTLYAGAFKQVPGKFELTVSMTRVMFPFFPLVALAAAFMGILNACGVFFLPAFSSALFNVASVAVGVLAATVLFKHGQEWEIQPIEGMAFGVLIGGAVQAFCQLPALYRAGYRWYRREAGDPVWHRDPALKRMLWMMVPGTVGLAATQVSILVNTILATSQMPGAVSWLNYSFRLMQFPIGLFGVSLASATLPQVSRLWVEKDIAGVQRTLAHSLRQVFAINLPASAGLAFLGYPIIELIFQYGRFTPDDTQRTSIALAMYAIGLTAYSAVKVLVPACYAFGQTRVAVISSVISVASTLTLNLLMVRPFGYWGLALGTSVGALINWGFLLQAVRRILKSAGGDFPIRPLLTSFALHLAVAALMGVICLLSHQALNRALPDSFFFENCRTLLPFGRALKVGLVVFEGGIVVLLLSRLFKITDTLEATDLLFRKIKNKVRRPKS